MKSINKLSVFAAVAILLSALSFSSATDKPKAHTERIIAKKDVPQYLQDISVTIRSRNHEGSGVIRVTKDNQIWIWTCGHVIEDLREVRETGDKKPVVEFSDAKVIKILTEDGRKVGETTLDVEVIRYSDARYGDDLALLRVRSKRYKPTNSVVFYLDKDIPPIGSDLYHCGSLLGSVGSNSLTSGIMSQHGRVMFNGIIFDQTTCTAFPGSSGGIVCLKDDGRYIGMVVRGTGESFNLIVPVRRLHSWAKRVGVEFALNDSLPVPSDETLKKYPVDDSITTKGASRMPDASSKSFPFMIRSFKSSSLPVDETSEFKHFIYP